MRYRWALIIVIITMCIPLSAKADKDFLQKIQNMVQTVQEKGMLFQEKVQEIKDMKKSLAEAAQSVKDSATGAVADIKGAAGDMVGSVTSGVDVINVGDAEKIKTLAGTRIEGLAAVKSDVSAVTQKAK